MFLAVLTLITALTISAVAIYYSVAGLVAIFAAAAVPIIIMGSALEIGKLVTAVWLHKYWDRATWWLKTYLSVAVAVLMFITSMGIFGFLSKAHIEQTAAAGEGVAQLERIDEEIARQRAVIERAEIKVQDVQSSGTGADANIQAQIDREQSRIDTAYTRVQPAIDEQNAIVNAKTKLFQDQVDKIDRDLALLQDYINNGEIRKAQGMVGTRADGAYGPATAEAFTAFQEARQAERAELVQQIVSLSQDPTIQAAREEIRRLRQTAEDQIAQSNELINRLRNQLGQDTGTDINAVIDEQNERIRIANASIDELVEQKFTLEAEYRKLEAEVGPIKYIAEFIYGDQADKNMLEEAVRWVIIVIIFVFDPLAVLLLIASQYTFNWYNKEREDVATEKESTDDAEDNSQGDRPVVRGNREDTPTVAEEQTDYLEPVVEETIIDQDYFSEEDPVSREEKPAFEQWNKMIEEAERAVSEEDDLEELANATPSEKAAMQQWKAEHPESSLKLQRRLLKQGKIEELPWMQYLELEDDYPEDDADPDAVEAARWAQEQLDKSKKKDSDLDGEAGSDSNQEEQGFIKGYIQNAEQNESTIWQRVKQAKDDK